MKKYGKPKVRLCLCLVVTLLALMTFGTAVAAAAEAPNDSSGGDIATVEPVATDVATEQAEKTESRDPWAEKEPVEPLPAIQVAYNAGLVVGKDTGMAEKDLVTMSEVCMIMARACGADVANPGGYWAEKAIVYCQEHGYVDADIEPTPEYFSEKAEKQVIVSAVMRMLRDVGYRPLYGKDFEPKITDPYSIDAEYLEDVKDAYRAGMFNDVVRADMFWGHSYVFRDELCEFLYSTYVQFPAAVMSDGVHDIDVEIYKTGTYWIDETDGGGVVRATEYLGQPVYNVVDWLSLMGTDGEYDVYEGVSNVYTRNKYSVPAVHLEYNGVDYEFTDHADGLQELTMNGYHSDTVAFAMVDGELYVDRVALRCISSKTFVGNDGTAKLLQIESYPSVIDTCGGTKDTKDKFMQAAWLAYNSYPDGYEIITKYTSKIVLYSNNKSIPWTDDGEEHAASADIASPNINFSKELFGDTAWDIETLATAMLHEATHKKQFRVSDYTEKQTMLEAGKLAYYMDQNGAVSDNTNNAIHIPVYGDYYDGMVEMLRWLDSQGYEVDFEANPHVARAYMEATGKTESELNLNFTFGDELENDTSITVDTKEEDTSTTGVTYSSR